MTAVWVLSIIPVRKQAIDTDTKLEEAETLRIFQGFSAVHGRQLS